MLNHELLLDLLHLILVPSLHVFHAILNQLLLLTDLVSTARLNLLDFFLQAIILEFEHLLDTRVFTKDCILPSLAFFGELGLETLILLMKLLLRTLSLLINRLFLLVDELGTQLMYSLLVFFHD